MTKRKAGSTRKATTEWHGLGKDQTTEYRTWAQMIHRCGNPRCAHYHNYGGRGISVCARWRESFLTFLADMGPRPSPDMSLDRIDNDGNYEPSNCRWATRAQQNRNHRGNRFVDVDGFPELLVDACARHGLNIGTVRNRMSRRGLSAGEAIRLGKSPRRKDWRGAP